MSAAPAQAPNPPQIGVLGATGRMGGWVLKLLETEFASRARVGAKAGQGDALEPLLAMDAVIDFSLPEPMEKLARLALSQPPGTPLPAFVVGSTGWSDAGKRTLEELARRAPVLAATNFSTGVGALLRILETAAPLLRKLGYQPVLVETHHRHKKDAPSGTALTLASAVDPAGPSQVPMHSIRAGEIIGDHEITFYGPGDHVTLGHFAQDRSIFARGAIEVALWLAHQRRAGKTGQLTMADYFAGLA